MTEHDDKHTGAQRMADKASDVAGGLMGRAEAKFSGSTDDTAFVENAAIGDLYEIKAAELALDRARSTGVRQAAEKMVHDHTTSAHQMRSALRMNETRGIGPLPGEVDARRRTMLDHLEAAPDDKFDATYLDQQIMAHKETIDLMTGYRDKGENPQLRSYAMGTAPVVERHLTRMEALRAELA